MAGPKGSKYYDIFLRQRLQLVKTEGDLVINEEGFTLLTEIMDTESIVAASKKMGISYRKAWGLLRDIEHVLGFQLVGKHRGGKDGGKTTLTSEGLELTKAFIKLRQDLEADVRETIRNFFKQINSISSSE